MFSSILLFKKAYLTHLSIFYLPLMSQGLQLFPKHLIIKKIPNTQKSIFRAIFLSGVCRVWGQGTLFPYLFQPLDVTQLPWFIVSLLHLQHCISMTILPQSHVSLTLFFASSFDLKDPIITLDPFR